VSGYVKGTGYEFAYTRDYDGDGGLTTGIVGARVCTPDPEQLRFHCWYWKVGDGPDDFNPYSFSYSPRRTANEKYWLLTGRNPNETKFSPLRPEQDDITEYEQPSPNDTRFLFSFYGDQQGMTNPTDASWNLAPGRTMKIVVAVFPGDNKEDLKRTARWAKEIYGQAQTLTTVVLPDTFPHYNPPEPPEIPKLYAELMDDGNRIDLYWDNRSEFSYDSKTVSSAIIGWQNPTSPAFKATLDSDPTFVDWSNFPLEFQYNPLVFNVNALINPYTAHRLRHDFQGYTVWGRSGSGSQEDWIMIDRWDKVETPVDMADYVVNINSIHADSLFIDFGGYLGIDKDLPNRNAWGDTANYTNYSHFNENYAYELNPANVFYGFPIYDHTKDYNPAILAQANAIATNNPSLPEDMIKVLQARLFKHPQMRDEVYDELMDTKMIPLPGHGGQVAIPPDGSGD
ncbi:MAG: hypothetical protein U1B83_09655, partial [Candidatus Cloacimonadaceae bacterium]|nr:hypothetical protein [Candidatus Cloacimonadaceae bacterium]